MAPRPAMATLVIGKASRAPIHGVLRGAKPGHKCAPCRVKPYLDHPPQHAQLCRDKGRTTMFKKALATAFGAVLAATLSASAQTFPNRAITMVIPFAAGGPTDVLGRVVGQRMSEILGQQIVIENVGGAGGQTGSKRVADATPDGYTIVLGTVGTHAQGQTL